MENDIIRDVIVGSPALAGVILISWMFLRTLRDITKNFSESSKETAKELLGLKEVIGANSEIIKQATVELGRAERSR